MLPVEYMECVKVWEETNSSNLKAKYELFRFTSWLNLAPHLSKSKSQRDLFRFPWEKIKKGRILNG